MLVDNTFSRTVYSSFCRHQHMHQQIPCMHSAVSPVHLVKTVYTPSLRHIAPRPFISLLKKPIAVRQRQLVLGRAVLMASAAAVLAVVRAAAPAFRSPQDRLAFAVHAAVLSSGYRLVAVGEQAQLEGLSEDAPDASISGWNSSSEQYTFAYLSDEEAGGSTAAAAASPGSGIIKLLVKALVLGDVLLTTLATDKASAEPKVLELALGDHVVGSSSSSGAPEGEGAAAAASSAGSGSRTKAYKNLDQLAATVASALSQLVGAAGGSDGSSSQKKQKTQEAAAAAASGSRRAEQQQQQQQQQQQREPDPDDDPLRIGPLRRPMRIGHDDIMPVLGGGPGGGVLPGGPPVTGPGGGGMHVGPGHPFFADRMRHPDRMPGRGGLGGMPGGPGGMRWDPISPEGLEGWRPEDFQRPRPGMGRGSGPRPPLNPDIDPDIMPPPPGRGSDWDSMFG
ncbi:hypothetical protein COO60DRAFT_370024 [Scenedesmus sp. NREL 46B-D3]|nr:hypothetical protein COO60DRAFT_370024 [Scenedesmus sp. NREL 46B-D3]